MIGGMDGRLVALVRIDSRRNEPLASRRPLNRRKRIKEDLNRIEV